MPNRILRDFRDSPTMAALSDLEERMFVRMILTADDFGLGLASNLHATCFPVADIPKDKSSLALASMARVGLIRLYRDASGRELFSIIKFGNKPRATSSKFYTWDECKHLASNLHTTCEQNHSECTPKPETGNRKPETDSPINPPPAKKAKASKQKAEPVIAEIACPEILPAKIDAPEVRTLIVEWLAMRKAVRKPATVQAVKDGIAALSRFGGVPEAIASLKASIMGNWTGLFAPKPDLIQAAPEPKRFDANGRELF